MWCPCCFTQLFCHCKSCYERNKGKPPWLFEGDGETEYCGVCRFTANGNFWEDLSISQVLWREGVSSLSDLHDKKIKEKEVLSST